MRTDSFNIAQSAQDECRSFIESTYGKEYIPEKPNVYSRKGAAAQEAHEAIRPTDVAVRPGAEGVQLEPAEQKLYALIWNRFVSSQMVPARIARRTVEATAGQENAVSLSGDFFGYSFPGLYEGKRYGSCCRSSEAGG